MVIFSVLLWEKGKKNGRDEDDMEKRNKAETKRGIAKREFIAQNFPEGGML